jgi:FG-GAP-like repeat/RTX calcium-binding nonapeptide repeat (4 copies)
MKTIPVRIAHVAELLETRIAPAYSAFVNGAFITLAGDAAGDTLEISAVDGLLKHNRFTAGDAGFESDFDFDSFAAGVQTVPADASRIVTLDLGLGNDTVILGSDGRADRLNATFSVINTGADGDTLRIDQSARTDAVNLTTSGNLTVGTGINVTRGGDVFGTLALLTGSGADTVTLAGVLATSTIVTTNDGDDVVTGSSVTTQLVLDSGAGNDRLTGGSQSDVLMGGDGNDQLTGSLGSDIIFAGDGNDLLVGGDGNDTMFGGAGLDTFTWSPGDDNDVIEGQEGADVLVFNGAAIAETFEVSANGGRILFTRNIASVVMDLNDVEEIQLKTLGGADIVTVNDLSATDLKAFRVNLAGPVGVPDGATDTVTLNGTNANDDIHVVTDGTSVQAIGVSPFVELSGFDTFDQLSIQPQLGTDNVFVSPTAQAKLNIVHSGETSNGALVGDLTFSAPTHNKIGKGPTVMVAGNLLGPGNDVVIANTKANSISILLNAGDGTFLPSINIKTGGKKPSGVALGDFNHDGRLDIAVCNKGSRNVSLFLNQGGGTFSDPTLFEVGAAPRKLRAGDINGDGETDLVMLSSPNKLTILAGDGAGGFAAPSSLATGGRGAADLVLGDFSGDGRTDIAVANSGSKNITVLVPDATFIFGAPQAFTLSSSPRSLAVGDIDGDGRLDLAVAHRVAKFASVLLNSSTGGTLGFASEITVNNLGRKAPTAIALKDIDLDGRDDLILTDTTPGAISVLRNPTGPATFLEPIVFDLDQNSRPKNLALIVTDLSEDGRPDFAVANGSLNSVTVLTRTV